MSIKSFKKNFFSRKKISFIIRNLLLIFFAGLTIATLIDVLFSIWHSSKVATQAKKEQNHVLLQSQVNNTSQKQTVPYIFEEKIGHGFELKVHQADLALLQTINELTKYGIRLEHENIVTRYFYGTPFQFQTITVHLSVTYSSFFKKLQKNLKSLVANSRLIINTHNRWLIVIDGQTTHLLIIKPTTLLNSTNSTDTANLISTNATNATNNTVKTTPATTPKKGYLAIIIDDMGESLLFARHLAQLNFPVTFSVLPYSTRTRRVCDLAQNYQIELMLHLPMEPDGYPERANPGPGALFVHMNPARLKTIFLQDLQQVPGAVGINNHMGSRFTRNKKSMALIFNEIKKRGLFFVDSLTTPGSVGKILARQNNVPYLQRQIFLDNIQDEKAILFQLQKAESIALKKGMAIAIGHPYRQTLKALQDWQKIRNKSIQVVQVRRLLKIKNSKF